MAPKGERSKDVNHESEESKEIQSKQKVYKNSHQELEAEIKDIPDISAGFMQQFNLAVSQSLKEIPR